MARTHMLWIGLLASLWTTAGSVTPPVVDAGSASQSGDPTAVRGRSPVAAESITPPGLEVSLGPLVRRGSVNLPPARALDALFQRTEMQRYRQYLECEDRCYLLANHYGGLVPRLQWAVRNGEPYGETAGDERSAYVRGRRIVERYLRYSRANQFRVPPHNNTALADVEALYVLEKNADALTHIHTTAVFHSTDRFNYLNLTAPRSDARQPAVALQAFSAAHRLGIPYAKGQSASDMSLGPHGSWIGAGQWLIERLAAGIGTDGSVRSPGHGGAEAYLFNAMLATQLLLWDAHVQPEPSWAQLAKGMMDHLVEELQRRGGACLPYLSTGSGCAQDLAGLFVRPSLMLWQDTGDRRYYDFAVKNLSASHGAYVDNFKQWNQVFSPGTQTAEAFESGVSWR